MSVSQEFYIGQVAPDSAFRAVFHKGRQVSPGMRDEARLNALLAERRRIAERTSTAWRHCLTCGEKFLSEGPHQRLCSRHRAAANAVAPDQAWPSYRARTGM